MLSTDIGSIVPNSQEPCDDPMFNSGPRKLLLNGQVGPTLASPQRDDWEIPANEVIIEDSLGEGAFGEVYKGVVKCPIINPKVRSSVKNAFCTPVAIKLLKSKKFKKLKHKINDEIFTTMHSISQGK